MSDSMEIIIQRRLANYWEQRTPVQYSNVEFDMPNDEPWLRLNILQGTSFNVGKHSTGFCIRDNGVIAIQVFTPKGTGNKKGLEYSDAVRSIFENQDFDGVSCRAASINTVGADNNWFQHSVSINFIRDRVTQ